MGRPILKINSTGDAVKDLTTLLKDRGYLSSVTRTFDSNVRMVVREFQARHVDERGRPLDVDGIVGPLTWWALENPDNRDIFDQPIPEQITKMPVAGGTPRGRAALATALAEMQAGAREVDANNSGPWVKKYLNGLIATPANWCAGFVSWCFAQHPNGIPFKYSLGARDIRNQFRAKGWLYEVDANNSPEPGDIIVWWRGHPQGWMGHIGLVHHFSEGGILYTIEGNKGGFPAPVRPFDYVMGRIETLLGFGRVPDIG